MPQVYARGRIEPPNLAELIRLSHARHGAKLKAIAVPTAPSFDWRTLGKVPPIKSQGGCGSCWDFSGCGVATCAMIQAGAWPADGTLSFSEQYYLDCVRDGGCNGDDNTTVLEDMKRNGAPAESDYGPYAGGSRRCRSTSSTTRYKIADWGFADSNGGSGVTRVADIKAALVTYGPVGCAVAAGSDWDNYSGGVSPGRGATNINHDVMIVGWHDDPALNSGGYWIVRNSWGIQWGEAGYMRLQYGADQIGTETVWAQAAVAPIPVPMPDPPPGPTPTPTPIPPVPVPPVPVPPAPATSIIIDPVARTVTVPAGFTAATTWSNVLKYWPDDDQIGVPKGWTINTR